MKPFWKHFTKLAMLAFAFVLMAVGLGVEADAAATYLKPYPKANYETTSPYYALTVDGQKVDVVYYFEHRGTETKVSKGRFAYAHLAYEGTATFEITNLTGNFGSYNLSPHSYGINAKVNGNKLTFDLTQANSRYIILQTTINGENEILVIACDPMENYQQYLEVDRVVNVVDDYGADPTGKEYASDKIQQAINDVSAAGGGTVYVPPGVYKIIYIDGKDNVTLYLEGGAFLRGSGITEDYKWNDSGENGRQGRRDLDIKNSKNFKVVGRGVIDGNSIALVEDRQTNGIDGWDDFRKGIVDGSGASNFLMDGVTVKDSAGWTFSIQNSKNITIKNVKLLADFEFIHTDGFDILSSQGVYIGDCLGVCGDDVFCPKGMNASSDMNDYLIENGVAFAHGGAGVKMGMQARSKSNNMVFRNIDVVQGYRAFTVAHDNGSANWSNITFEDIRMEKLNTHTGTGGQFRCGPFVIWVWGDDCANAVVDGITVNRCSIENSQGRMAWLQGTKNESKGADGWVKNVTFTDCTIDGVVLTDDNYSQFVNHGVNIENIHYYAVAAESAVTYEAENATCVNTTQSDKSWASNGKTVGDVGLINNEKLGTVTFNVEQETGGTTELGIYCVVKGDRSYYVTVNGGEPIKVDFTGPDWNTVVNKTITVELQPGNNTILITNPYEAGPNLDRITVRHIHSLSQDWSYDDTYHWHDYDCGHDLTGQKSAHKDVDSDYYCDTCGYNMAPADPEDIIVTNLEAENAVLTNGATKVTNDAASAGAHAGNIGGASDGTVTFNITETADCAATMQIYYIQDATRSFEVSVNGETKTVSCQDGNSWTVPNSTPASMNITLKAGSNTIVFSGVGTEYAPNLDKIVLTHIHKYAQAWTTDEAGHWRTPTCGHDEQRKEYGGHIDADGSTYCDVCNYKTSAVNLPADGGASTVIFDKEAESATLSNGAGAVENAAASNGAHAGNLGGNSDGTATFTFDSGVSGTYTLSLYYIQDASRQFEVEVNGTVYTVNASSSGSWTVPAAAPVTLQVNINQSSNTIKVSGVGTAYAPNLDRLVVEQPHTYASTWSHTDEYHWREATCGCDLVTDPGLHLGIEDSICDVCGYTAVVEPEPTTPSEPEPTTPSEPEPAQLFDIVSVSNKMGNELALFFYVNKADLNGTDYYAEITMAKADGSTVELNIPFTDWENHNSATYRFCFSGIAAKEMTDNITAVVRNSDGTVASSARTISMRDYTMLALAAYASDTTTCTMLVDMLNYGAAAQTYFGYNTDDPANNKLTAAQIALATTSVELNNNRMVGDNYGGVSLTYANNILLTMYFTGITEDMYAVVEFTDHYGNPHTDTVLYSEFSARGSLLGVPISSLTIADFRQVVKCTVYHGNGTVYGYAEDSPESYAATMGANDPLFQAAARFSQSAHNYLHR